MVERSFLSRTVKKNFLQALLEKGGEANMSVAYPIQRRFGSYRVLEAFDALIEDGIILPADGAGRGIRFAKGKQATK